MRKAASGMILLIGMGLGLYFMGGAGIINLGTDDIPSRSPLGNVPAVLTAMHDGLVDRSGERIPVDTKAFLPCHARNRGLSPLGRWSVCIPRVAVWGVRTRGMRSRKRYPPNRVI